MNNLKQKKYITPFNVHNSKKRLLPKFDLSAFEAIVVVIPSLVITFILYQIMGISFPTIIPGFIIFSFSFIFFPQFNPNKPSRLEEVKQRIKFNAKNNRYIYSPDLNFQISQKDYNKFVKFKNDSLLESNISDKGNQKKSLIRPNVIKNKELE